MIACIISTVMTQGLSSFSKFLNAWKKSYAHDLLDIFAANARSHMLFGKKLITLVQVSDPAFETGLVGATAVM